MEALKAVTSSAKPDSSMWLTPKTPSGGGQSERMTPGGGQYRKLEDQIEGELWMTPNVPNGGRVLSEEDVLAKGSTANGKRQVSLEMQSKFWGTPNSHERTHTAREVDHGEQLANQAEYFPTPAARDFRSESGGQPR